MVEKQLKITGLDCMDCARGQEMSIAAAVVGLSLIFNAYTLESATVHIPLCRLFRKKPTGGV